ncbi:hypothetical protein V8F20_008977 [Naviculisporaceae sp. PSN 640]
MLSRSIARASQLRLAARPVASAIRVPIVQRRTFLPDAVTGVKTVDEKYPDSDYPNLTEAEDPEMNGGYINPPRVKRQHRDPHGDWWDKQERRNFGEPVHEDNDVLGMFTTYDYTWISPGKGALQLGAFIALFVTVCLGIKQVYPDQPAYPREFEGGLEKELGGKGAVRARMPGDPDP